jgi:hypothetical protein
MNISVCTIYDIIRKKNAKNTDGQRQDEKWKTQKNENLARIGGYESLKKAFGSDEHVYRIFSPHQNLEVWRQSPPQQERTPEGPITPCKAKASSYGPSLWGETTG